LEKKVLLKKIVGVTLIILGAISVLTPFTPFGWLIFVGLGFLGVRIGFWARIKSYFNRWRTNGGRMADEIIIKLKPGDSLHTVHSALIPILTRAKTGTRLGYCAGLVSSEGSEHVTKNFERLVRFARHLEQLHGFAVFSSGDIFRPEVLEIVKHSPEHDFYQFWRNVLSSGLVTDVFMTPRWERSRGAMDEHETAKKLGIAIYYLDFEI